MLKLRKASAKDTPTILHFIRELAKYERAPRAVSTTEKDLKRDGFGKTPKFKVVIAYWDNRPAGMAFYFYNYSTWKGRPGIYLEDIFVEPELRGKGVGKALMTFLAEVAIAEKCHGIKWEVLGWNKPAIDFYKGLGAEFREEWRTMQIRGNALRRIAKV